jgi:glycosyltransferase involved in cell wall biosynthesis
MRVAHISLYPPKGHKHAGGSGVASYTKNLVTHLADEHIGTQFVLCNKLDREDTYREHSIFVKRCFDRNMHFVTQLQQELRDVHPDIVHIQQEIALFGNIATAYSLQLLVRAWRKSLVITLHGVVDPDIVDEQFVRSNNSRAPAWLVRRALQGIYKPLVTQPSHIIVHEQLFKDILVRSYGAQPDTISVIPHGVEVIHPGPVSRTRERLHIPTGAQVVLFMGYATGYKGLDLLIDGFAHYAQRNPTAYLIIGAGKHPKLQDDPHYLSMYEALQHKASSAIPANQYQWIGFIPEKNIPAYYGAADVSIYPYTAAISSSGPMSIAIGGERPFLCSDAFTNVFASWPQVLFQKTPEAMSGKLDYFFAHKAEYADISRALKRQRTWESVGRTTAGVYKMLAGNASA